MYFILILDIFYVIATFSHLCCRYLRGDRITVVKLGLVVQAISQLLEKSQLVLVSAGKLCMLYHV